ncbi:uncharacterized protein [Diabrotica undecimpunctata]|uniref:uncharacterized protein n=1 Tax=Diabrotica undecimpunctata TaxID=50387 RepID=UPI003B63738F
MQPVIPKYSMIKPESTRTNNFAYYFDINHVKVKVCKLYFMNTLDINSAVISTAQKKKTDEGFVDKDNRGGNPNAGRPRIHEDVKNFARRHIESFPIMDSHYCRARTERKYLQGDLNLTEMYRQYCIKCTEENKMQMKKHLYESIFNTEYNISFFTPKKDACCTCMNYENLNADEKIAQHENFNVHIQEKKRSRIEKDNDVKNSSKDTTVSCFDLQAVQTIPEGSRSDFFYKRRLSCYNFTIYDIKKKAGFSYFWHEGVARRGVNEIGSCTLNYLKENPTNKIVFYSDNCPGQNKNKFIVVLFMFCVRNLEIKSITHKFFVVGHSQNEGDAMHALIERQKKRALKAGPLYVPTQLLPIISLAKKTGQPYTTKEMVDFYDIKSLVMKGDNFTINEDGAAVKWNDIHIIEIRKESPHLILYKNSFADENFKIINTRRRTRRQTEMSTLKPAYTQPPGVTAAKKKDLLSLCKTGAIPRPYWDFYNSLSTNERPTEEDSD